MVKSTSTAGRTKQNSNLLTLTNSNLLGSKCQKTTQNVTFLTHQNDFEDVLVQKSYFSKSESALILGVPKV